MKIMSNQLDLFDSSKEDNKVLAPRAKKYRPQSIDQFIFSANFHKKYPFIKNYSGENIILWGPPGCGKTSLATILGQLSGYELYKFNAVMGGVGDLKKIIDRCLEMKKFSTKHPIIFIDEIHRFNKAQQDSLLQYMEDGDLSIIGATTEYPNVSVNKAILSRSSIVELTRLSAEQILNLLNDVASNESTKINQDLLLLISNTVDGDARKAINALDLVIKNRDIKTSDLKNYLLASAREYDSNDSRHYDVISAFIKSIRGSDPDAAILWLAVMLDGGERPEFIARRMIILASEDIGLANPMALSLAVSTLEAVKSIGMPESRIILSHCVIYLAQSAKSNSAYKAIDEALAYVKNNQTITVPDYLKNYPKNKSEYKYPHNFEKNYVEQDYTEKKDKIKFYKPCMFDKIMKI